MLRGINALKILQAKNKLRAYKEFAYIYLFFDWESPLANEPEQDRHQVDNSGLTTV